MLHRPFTVSSAVLRALLIAAPLATLACAEPEPTAVGSRKFDVQPAVHRQYGVPQTIGNGTVRTYVVLDEKNDRAPVEVGVALSENAMHGLPAPAPDGAEHDHSNMRLLAMPAQNPTPYKFVQFDWNPKGHEPDSVYGLPHFDFHFYRVPVEVMESIIPSDPQWMAKAANLPSVEFRAPFYLDAGSALGAPQGLASVPMMGLHWLDVRSPELQKLAGHPERWAPFSKTFFYGSWDGAFIFDEPMITREYLLSVHDAADPADRDVITQIPTAQRYAPAGYYGSAYRITYDAQAREYRVAMTQLSWRN